MNEPTHIISLGAGVQSSTMALMAAHGEITPMPTAAIFADTQAEPRRVYEWLDWLEKQLPFPVHRVTRGSLTEALTTLRERKDKLGYWAYSGIPAFTKNASGSRGIVPRQCTQSFKVEEIKKAARKIGGIKRGQKTVGVIQWIGISRDEAQRMKPSREPWVEHRWPLIEIGMSRRDCLAWMERNGYPQPPRSSCVYCPYHSDAEWRRIRNEAPDEFAEAVRVDYEYRRLKMVDYEYRRLKMIAGAGPSVQRSEPFIHSSLVPLDKVDFSTAEDKGQLNMFGQECEGMCGV